MRRRDLLIVLGGAAAAWPPAAHAQQPTMPRICVLSGLPESDPEAQKMTHALVEGLSSLDGSAARTCRSIYAGPLIPLGCSS